MVHSCIPTILSIGYHNLIYNTSSRKVQSCTSKSANIAFFLEHFNIASKILSKQPTSITVSSNQYVWWLAHVGSIPFIVRFSKSPAQPQTVRPFVPPPPNPGDVGLDWGPEFQQWFFIQLLFFINKTLGMAVANYHGAALAIFELSPRTMVAIPTVVLGYSAMIETSKQLQLEGSSSNRLGPSSSDSWLDLWLTSCS